MAFKFNFGKRLRVTGHEYRKMNYGAALRWGSPCENRFVSKRWHLSFKYLKTAFLKRSLIGSDVKFDVNRK